MAPAYALVQDEWHIDEPPVQTTFSQPSLCLCSAEPARSDGRYHGNDLNERAEWRARMRSRDDITQTVETYADTVLRVCAIYLREKADREDAFQDTFLRYARHERPFTDDEHRKAWLIRVASNVCKDMLKRASAKVEHLDELSEERLVCANDDGEEGQRHLERADLISALYSLDEKYRTVLYLKYYENYTAAQIARMLGVPENTVYTNLARGRRALKGVLAHGI